MLTVLGLILLLFAIYAYQSSMFSVFFGNDAEQIHPSIAEDARLPVLHLIAKYGYNAESHIVTTEDGYILELHRIAGGPKSPPKKGKKVVLLVHALTTSSVSFLIAGPYQALAYRLADEGYDIWMTNARGNAYSNNHTILEPFGSRKERKLFWSFTFHEIGYYDLPASIDFILAHTGQKKLQYIGHSQGTTAFFVMASEKTEYNNKIEMMHALGPTAYLSQVISPPIRAGLSYLESIEAMFYFLGVNYLYLSEILTKICSDIPFGRYYCEQSLPWIMGESDQLNTTQSPMIFAQLMAGAAVSQFVHYGQLMNSGHFRQFDYGQAENIKRYQQPTPPNYDLNNIQAPVALYCAPADSISVPSDIEKLRKQLPNVIKHYLVPYELFNHADFVLGKDASHLVYNEIVKTIKRTNIL